MNNYHKLKIKEGTECFKRIQEGAMLDVNNYSYKAIVPLKKWFVDFGKEHELFSHAGLIGDATFTTILTEKGCEIIETKNGFEKYYKRNIIRKQKIEDYQYYSVKYWWLPLIISIGAVLISFLK